jgi:hypothetical protein
MLLGSGACRDLGVAQETDNPRSRELAEARAAGAVGHRYFR